MRTSHDVMAITPDTSRCCDAPGCVSDRVRFTVIRQRRLPNGHRIRLSDRHVCSHACAQKVS